MKGTSTYKTVQDKKYEEVNSNFNISKTEIKQPL